MAYEKFTIALKKYSDVMEEYIAGGSILPGMVLLLDDDGTVKAHDNDAPAAFTVMVALEDDLQGKGIDDAYASGDPVQCWTPYSGDVFYGILEDGADIKIGDFLESNGVGYLQKFTSGQARLQALETLDLSGSSGEESSVGVLGFNKRIKVKVA